jgi:transposase
VLHDTLVDMARAAGCTGRVSPHRLRHILTAIESVKVYPDALRRVSYLDTETNKRLKFLTNNFVLPAFTIAQIYKSRWQVELFFKWIKQHLRIKSFFGTSANAVRTQIWIAVSTYLLVAIVRKRLGTAGESLPNSTDSQCHAFRESAHFTGSGCTIFPGRLTRRPQAVDSV